MPVSNIDRELTRLETDLKQLEAEYNMFFAGRLPKPPWETRARVEAVVKQLDRGHIPNTGDRFRFTTLQSRYARSSICGIAVCAHAKRAVPVRSPRSTRRPRR